MAQFTLTIKQLIENEVNIFDFNYPLYKEEYRETFEKLFIDYFLFDEIGFETVGQFKHRLKSKLNTVMPYYNKLYETQDMEQRILDNYDVTEEYTREVTGDNTRNLTGDNTRNLTGSNNTTGNSVNKNLYKDTPKTKVDIEEFTTLTNITKNIGDVNNNTSIEDTETIKNTTVENSNNTATEKWTRTMKGNIGVQTDSDAIIKYWQSLRNITQEIFDNELSSLFMGVY